MALTRGNNGLGVTKILREIQDDDAHKHVQKVLEIAELFGIPNICHVTLTGVARIWKDKLPGGSINTWDLLEKAFIQKYSLPSKTAKQMEEIHNFKKEKDETLCRA
ncbi:hypothetical protein Tco_0418899 [Tanacetum coccineum]